jgi:hypothetical protein
MLAKRCNRVARISCAECKEEEYLERNLSELHSKVNRFPDNRTCREDTATLEFHGILFKIRPGFRMIRRGAPFEKRLQFSPIEENPT